MPSEVILPRVDMDMTTGKIAKWFVEPGAAVTKGQPLFEIETDKAAMEIEAPASGTIRDLASASGDDIPVGSVVAWIFAEGEAHVASFKLATQAEKVKGERARVSVEDHRFDSALPPPIHTAPEAGGADRVTEATAADRPRATPMARRLARTHGLDLGALKGSGPRGRVQAADIAAVTGRSEPPVDSKRQATPSPVPRPAGALSADRPVDRSPAPAPAPKPASARAGALNLVRLREGEGNPTLLIHGFGADVNTWRPYLAGVASSRPVLALDLPGHGASPLYQIASFSDLVDAVEAALADAAVGPVHVVAHSLGGAVMTAVAARYALDIRSLLLLAPAGLGPSINGPFLGGFLNATSEASLTPWMHELVADPAVISAAFVRATLKAREGTDLVVTQRKVADAVFPDGTQAFSIRADLAKLTVPTRIVTGGADRIIPAAQALGLPGLIALHHFTSVGHMPQFEIREAIAAIAGQMAAN